MEHESWRHTGFCFLSPSPVYYVRTAYRRSRDRIHFHRRLTFTHKHSYYTEYSSIQTGVFRPLVQWWLIESDLEFSNFITTWCNDDATAVLKSESIDSVKKSILFNRTAQSIIWASDIKVAFDRFVWCTRTARIFLKFLNTSVVSVKPSA